MNARTAAPEGWVTVAQAAKALSEAGDSITAPNVSRYLARFPEIAQRKAGKFRFVDMAALAAHRNTNVLVGEKRAARDLDDVPAAKPAPALAVELDDDDDEVAGPAAGGSALNEANVRLKHLVIRDRELDLAVKEGTLIPDVEVLTIVSGVLAAFVAELERQETGIATRHGREMAAEFRRVRKEAQGKAAAKLLELARANLPEDLAAKLAPAPPAGG